MEHSTSICNRTQKPAQRMAEMLQLLQDSLPLQKQIVHASNVIYDLGKRFRHLYIVNSGFIKTVNVSSDGIEQVVGLHFKGDWLGLDGIANGQYGCNAVALDSGEVWTIAYDALLQASAAQPSLLNALREAMSRELIREHDSMLSRCNLPADARVAQFLRNWVDALAQRGLRNDLIALRMSRAEIGNYLGMKVETVSRALSRLARGDVIRFSEVGRRDIRIPQVEALTAFIQRSAEPTNAALVHCGQSS